MQTLVQPMMIHLRQMADGTNRLKYRFVWDNDRAGVFGNTEATGQSVNWNWRAVTTTVYGRIVGTENAGTLQELTPTAS